MKIFVIGAGTMGAGIAQSFASAGNQVLLCDIQEEFVAKGLAMIRQSLASSVRKSKITPEDEARIIAAISTTIRFEDAADCDLILEAVFENIDVKRDLFKKLDDICQPDTIFASNTSSLSITELSQTVKRSDRLIGMHFFNPAPIMKLVELVRGVYTSQDTYETVKKIALDMNKVPVDVADAPGFIVNRVLIPMINEAIEVLAEGIASAEDIDQAMKLGANHPIGPLALSDLIGNDVVLAIMNTLLQETGDPKYRPSMLLKKMVRARKLGRKTGIGFYQYTE